MVGRSWRADETYIKVNGGWMFLYRAVDQKGRTVASYLSRTRDKTAARIFFRQALRRHGEPRSITLDGFEPSHAALRYMGMRNEFNYRFGGSRPHPQLQVPEQHRGNSLYANDKIAWFHRGDRLEPRSELQSDR